eukprot:g73624.t1
MNLRIPKHVIALSGPAVCSRQLGCALLRSLHRFQSPHVKCGQKLTFHSNVSTQYGCLHTRSVSSEATEYKERIGNAARIYDGKSPEQILEFVSKKLGEKGNHEVTTQDMEQKDFMAPALYYIGRGLRHQPTQSLARIYEDARYKQLLETVQQELPHLPALTVAHVWTGVRDLDIRDKAFLTQLSLCTTRIAPSFNAHDISTTLNAMSRLGEQPSEAFAFAICLAAANKVNEFTAQGLALTLNALCKLDFQPGDTLLQQLCARAEAMCGEFTPQYIALTLNALPRLRFTPSQEFLQKMCQEANAKAMDFNHQNISNMLNGLVKLKYDPGEELLERLCEQALECADDFTPQNLATTLNALGRLEFEPGELLLRTLSLKVKNDIGTFTEQDISLTIHAFGKLEYTPDQKVMDALCEQAMERAPTFDGQAIANALHGLSKIKYQPNQELLQVLCQQGARKAASFNAQEISTFLAALPKLEYNLAVLHSLHRACKRAIKIADTFTAQGIAAVLNACCKLGFYPGENLVCVLCEEAGKKAPSFTAHGISSLLSSLATLGYNPGPTVMSKICEVATRNADFMANQTMLVTALYDLCVINFVDHAVFRSWLATLSPPQQGSFVSSRLQKIEICLQLEHACSGLALPAQSRPLPLSAGEKIKLLMNLEHKSPSQQPAGGGFQSSAERALLAVLRDQFRFQVATKHNLNGLQVDIAVPDQKLVFELDGKAQFLTCVQHYRHHKGTKLFRIRLLKAMGWRVVTVPFYEWKKGKYQDRRQAAAYIQSKLESLKAGT